MIVIKAPPDAPLQTIEFKKTHNASVSTTMTSSSPISEISDEKTQYLEDLGIYLKKWSNGLGKGRTHPVPESFLSQKLAHNTTVNLFSVLKYQELDKADLALLETAENKMVSTLSASPSSLLPVTLSSFVSQPSTVTDRHICDKISALIEIVNDEYVSIFESAVEKQTNFWRDFTEIQGGLASYTSSSGSDIKLEKAKLLAQLNELGNLKYEEFEKSTVYPVQPPDGGERIYTTKEDAEKWAKELGFPAECVVKIGGSSEIYYIVTVDFTPIKQMIKDVNALGTDATVTMNTAKYQAWLTGFNANAENVKTTCQTVTTKYSSANNLYDSMIKLLTSTITTMTESAKAYLKY
ncbi:TPA: IpaD/SipD/SspD family type III secretion system needle tip protein [Yersinia enterocolitica]|nr:IpaD/SipD/SspD family type III secretion system needle tip protein [Yersinia enterocolitica]